MVAALQRRANGKISSKNGRYRLCLKVLLLSIK
jgi:hypothetical protein